MRRLLAASWSRSHQLLGWRVARAGLVMIVANLVEAVRVGGSSTRWGLDWTSVHPAGSSTPPLDCLDTNTYTVNNIKSEKREKS